MRWTDFDKLGLVLKLLKSSMTGQEHNTGQGGMCVADAPLDPALLSLFTFPCRFIIDLKWDIYHTKRESLMELGDRSKLQYFFPVIPI